MSWWVAGATVVSGVIGGISGSKSADKAAKAQQNAADQATRESARQYDQTRQDLMPWMDAGRNALVGLQQVQAGDFSGFRADPGYQWSQQQGLQALDRSAAARGSLFSGGADADRIAFGQGLASQQFGDWYNRQAALAGVGQTTANQLGQFGAQNAANQGNALIGAGNARASAYQQQNQAWQNALGGITSGVTYAAGNNWGRR